MQRFKKGRILHAVTIHNGVVYTAGLVADDLDTDMAAQTRQLCRKVDDLLAEAGTDKTKIIRSQIFVTDISKKPEMDAVWLEWLGEDLPCRCTVGVADLGNPRILIEIVITAAQ
ncbi:RidA family protein [Pelagibacterium sp. H642]|uniref:RidA family protein n=1 Tax=Pelagibacterium sp. H642 TaxID=1881069 RepID=UPI002814ED1A|nr:RidA family protein [Pelagibacterium sp. H642]WMT89378.1 RidA family protein [Pelagibacterium sp. H642]